MSNPDKEKILKRLIDLKKKIDHPSTPQDEKDTAERVFNNHKQKHGVSDSEFHAAYNEYQQAASGQRRSSYNRGASGAGYSRSSAQGDWSGSRWDWSDFGGDFNHAQAHAQAERQVMDLLEKYGHRIAAGAWVATGLGIAGASGIGAIRDAKRRKAAKRASQ